MVSVAQRESLLGPEQHESTDELVRRAQTGDKAAFELLYRGHAGRVYALCLRIIADSDRAAELTQDVFVRVWQMIGSFRWESAFASWLHRVTVNVVLVDLRSERRRTGRVMVMEELPDVGAHQSSPESAMDIEKAIGALPPQARAILVLHDIEGYRHDEIAERMGLATGTCKAQLHRARKLLREALGR
ncbi:MAG: RNA polymerase sigma factor [Bacteroidota bacterium]